MSDAALQFTRLDVGRTVRGVSLAEALQGNDIANETWLLVSPHDDDLCVGAGLWVQAAVRAGVRCEVLIVTDGSMGYCSLEQRDKIVEIRRAEALASFSILGIEHHNTHWIGYPDAGLYAFQGRRAASATEISIAGHTGLQNAFTYYLRKFHPRRVLVPSHTDLHPDHRITSSELMISLFHATGGIWPELGAPLDTVPKVYELAVYCDFQTPPNLEVRGDEKMFDTKLRSIAAYKSQAQIESLVEGVRRAGPYEYLREVDFQLYSAQMYKSLFA